MAPTERREQVVDAALRVIVEQGYEGASIEAIARTAGVTRPVIYDHFRNLGELLGALIDREEHYALAQIAQMFPADPGTSDPVDVLAGSVRRFLDAVVSRPDTWRIILLPSVGTSAIVRDHVETNRARTLERVQELVRWTIEQSALPRASTSNWRDAPYRASRRRLVAWSHRRQDPRPGSLRDVRARDGQGARCRYTSGSFLNTTGTRFQGPRRPVITTSRPRPDWTRSMG